MPPLGYRAIGQHDVMAIASHDEVAREDFVASMYFAVQSDVFPGNKLVWDSRTRTSFERLRRRSPINRHEIRHAMESESIYQYWSSLRRVTQEMKQATGEEMVYRQIDELRSKVLSTSSGRSNLGSLQLDNTLEPPNYVKKVDFHAQPGGYLAERSKKDITPAAIYDPGVYVLTKGFMGPFSDAAGSVVVNFLMREYPNFRPPKILDLGCAVGHSTLPYSKAFPEAEIHAIDISAPMLRYAYARAKSLSCSIHFSQQNAEATRFEPASFELVVSHILLHETSSRALTNIFGECLRLLKPGGLMLHLEQRQHKGMPIFEQFCYDWDTLNNNEPYWGALHDTDLSQVAQEVGFSGDSIVESLEQNMNSTDVLADEIEQGGDFKRTAVWSIFGATKAL